MIVLLILSSPTFFQKMSNNTGGSRDGNNLWEQLFGREGCGESGTTHNMGNSNSCNEITSHDVDIFGRLLHIQARARAVQQSQSDRARAVEQHQRDMAISDQQYQRERADIENQLSIMHSLVHQKVGECDCGTG